MHYIIALRFDSDYHGHAMPAGKII